MKPLHIPVRMCVVCRSKLPRSELIRLVKDRHDTLVEDTGQKAQGRGMYLCRNQACIDKFLNNKRFRKKFKLESSSTLLSGQVE
ncbi:MAG: YlxR family protein [Vulcanimicrobiota bacterium]